MRSIPSVMIFDLDEPGCVDWRGSLADLCRANRDGMERPERRAMLRQLRAAGRVTLGGGAAPAFMIATDEENGQ